MEEQHEDHGHSTAAWTGVGVILVGSAVAAVAVAIPNLVLGIIGAVIIIAGVVAGKVLSMAGYGSEAHHAQAGSSIDAPDEVGSQTLGKS
ncbi:HGxxPAAW family protein [Terrabacter sp. NPDC080008]|uniref:HGxxPAAW family protein n=1 Tax=Terrabacter sp. NPDC080008 TaxID=3155176 RepID=UPI00344EB154